MNPRIAGVLSLSLAFTLLAPSDASAQRRRVVRVRAPRAALVIRPGHPIRRALPAAVVIRPAHRAIVVTAPLVFLPAMIWTAAVVTMPARDHLVWQDSESIDSDDGWVDTHYGIDASGDALFLQVAGKVRLNFAEVTFANGNVQVVDFNEKTHDTGLYRLMAFADGRHVKTVRILAQSKSEETKLSVYLSK